ncbi:MAG: hypothetical protein M3Y44_03090 [Actinomycetota bacterium]|nr:hypothetical protein [Actinomycetota bacterium]
MTLPASVIRFVAALTLAGATTIAVASQPTQAATTPTHVAVAVDFGSSGGVRVACLPAGGSGSAVLGAGFQVEYNNSGLVAIINGVGSRNPTPKLYWSYWHSSGASWSYANSGPATFHPAAGTVEGWAYNDGSVGPATAPSYATICAGQDPAPPPTHAATQPSVARHPSPPPAAQPGQPGRPGQPDSSSGPGTSNESSTSSGARSGSPTKQHSGTSGIAPSGGGAESTASATPNSTQPAGQLVGAKPGGHTSAAPAVGTGLALLAVAALSGTAFWRLRRQKLGPR